MTAPHVYLSTACWHEAAEPDPHAAATLHAECATNDVRWDGTDKVAASCKWCGAPCTCPGHANPEEDPNASR